MEYKSEIEICRRNPRKYFNRNIDIIKYDNEQDNLSLVVALSLTAPFLGEFEVFQKLHDQIKENKRFKSDLYLQYFYYSAEGNYWRFTRSFFKALESYKYANKLSYVLKDNTLIVRSLLKLATVYGSIDDGETALYYARLAMKHTKCIDDYSLIGNIYLSLGAIFGNNGDYPKSKECLLKGLDNYKNTPNSQQELNYAVLLKNMGEVSLLLNEMENALKYTNQAYELFKVNQFKSYNSEVHDLLVKIYKKLGNYEKALFYSEKAYEDLKDINKLKKDLFIKHNKNELQNEIELNTLSHLKNETLYQTGLKFYSDLVKKNINENKKNKLIKELLKAIENKEITAYFQPKYSISKKEIIGAEALVRWIKKDGNFIFPNDFINHVDEAPIINKITKVVINKSFGLCHEMIENGYKNFIVSINISPYQLLTEDIVWMLEREFAFYNVKPQNVEVEITEKSYFGREQEALREIEKLKELGVLVSLDDFGSGYSSLSSVSTFSFDVIKIDRSLVKNISKKSSSKLLFKALIEMLDILNFRIVAEGVETEEEVNIIASTPCDVIQGYYLSKPLSIVDFRDRYIYYKS